MLRRVLLLGVMLAACGRPAPCEPKKCVGRIEDAGVCCWSPAVCCAGVNHCDEVNGAVLRLVDESFDAAGCMRVTSSVGCC